MRLELEAMNSFLQEYSNTPVQYFPNPGNAGDSLIAAGTYQALRRAGVPFKCISAAEDLRGKVVFLGGGGNFVPMYGEIRSVLEIAYNTADKVVILPHTIRGNEDLLGRLRKDTVIFCRDPESYSHVIRNSEATAYLSHDMAFHLNVPEFYERSKKYTEMPHVYKVKTAETVLAKAEERSNTYFMRLDNESTGQDIPSDNVDISKLFEFGVWPDNAEKSAWCLFEAVRSSRRVVTDRLHVGIASALLDHRCDLYDNNYGKNSLIYRHSIRKMTDQVVLSN